MYLRESLAERHGGWIVDDGADHTVTLEAAALSRLYALLLLDEFTGLFTVHAVTVGGKPYVEREAGGGLVGTVYDHRTASLAPSGACRAGRAADSVVNTFLAEMDGIAPVQRVFVIGATNRPTSWTRPPCAPGASTTAWGCST